MKARLVDLVVGSLTKEDGAVYEFPEGKTEVVVGRTDDSDIQILKDLPDEVRRRFDEVRGKNEKIREGYKLRFGQVSRKHCALYIERDKVYLQDKGSKNKTYFGNEEIEGLGVDEFDELQPGQKVNLKNGSIIGLSPHYKLKLIIGEEEIKLAFDDEDKKVLTQD